MTQAAFPVILSGHRKLRRAGNIARNCLWDMASHSSAAMDTVGSVRRGLSRDTLDQPTWAQLTVGCLLHALTEPLVSRAHWELGQQLRKAFAAKKNRSVSKRESEGVAQALLSSLVS